MYLKYFKHKILWNLLPISRRTLRSLSTKMLSKEENGVKMFLNPETEPFKNIFTPELNKLHSIFKKFDFDIRIAGGAVRDLIINKQPNDIDFASPATPKEMKNIFEAEGIRMINANGEKHGTITARIGEKNFEITTLRIDVVTNGRHAEVEFTTDWRKDAGRRDLTINSMFLGLDGNVYDYFNGYEDLKNHKIIFVGDPSSRIQEDFLRILRYFRFYGRIALEPDNHDSEILQSIKSNADGLKNISGERIWMELSKIIMGPYTCDIIKRMLILGIGPFIGLPDKCNINEFERLCKLIPKGRNHPIVYITALLNSDDELHKFNQRIKLSAFERDLALFIIKYRNEKLDGPCSLITLQRYILLEKGKTSQVKKHWSEELLKYLGRFDLLEELNNWTIPTFPVTGDNIKNAGVPGGKKVGLVMDKIREMWVSSDCKLSGPNLIKKIPEILKDL